MKHKIETLLEMIENYLEKDILISTHKLLTDIEYLFENEVEECNKDKIIISCHALKPDDAPPKGAFISWVIDVPGQKQIKSLVWMYSKTNHQAYYDSINMAISSFFGISNNPNKEVNIRCDNHKIINEIIGLSTPSMNCIDKLQGLHDMLKELPVKVTFSWRPSFTNESTELAKQMILDEILKIKKENENA